MEQNYHKIKYLLGYINSIYRKSYRKIFKKKAPYYKVNGRRLLESTETNGFIKEKIIAKIPFMVARYGSSELNAVVKYLAKRNGFIKTIPDKVRNVLCKNAGFFPNQEKYIDLYCEKMIKASKELNLVGLWNDVGELYLVNTYAKNSVGCQLWALEPYYFPETSWTAALKDKNVLVIHPFESTIKKQYEKRTLIYPSGFLPNFNLLTIKAVQTIAGEKDPRFDTWFDALEYMQEQIRSIDFDVAIIGCGAYGFLLAAYVKSIGKQAIHLGGATQILFGIKGKRWEQSKNPISTMFNEHWVYPSEDEKPASAKSIEDGCYW